MSALLLNDTLKPTTPLTSGAINQMLQHFASLSDGSLLQLVDCRKLSTLLNRLLKGLSNSIIDRYNVQ